MNKIAPFESNGVVVGYTFDCPGCEYGHAVHLKPHKNGMGASWTWNGSLDKPTFRPSLLSSVVYNNGKSKEVCHCWVTDGKIQFPSDCTHKLAGQTVDIPDFD